MDPPEACVNNINACIYAASLTKVWTREAAAVWEQTVKYDEEALQYFAEPE